MLLLLILCLLPAMALARVEALRPALPSPQRDAAVPGGDANMRPESLGLRL